MNPFVSIITVSLNAADTIEDTIVSVARQERGFEVEHICVDGGSSDGTRTIIDSWAERCPHLKRIYETDRGIYDAMNKGLSAASGEYALFLNADDFLVGPRTLAHAMDGLVPGANKSPDLIVGDVSMGSIGRWGIWRHRRVPRMLEKRRGLGLFPVHQGLLAKRSLLMSVGGFDPEMRIASDIAQYYEMERRFPLSIRIVPTDIAFMRAGGTANSGAKAVYLGTREIYRHLLGVYSPLRAGGMAIVKTLQSLSELRLGRCPHHRWFAAT